MSESMFLSEEELADLTGCRTHWARVKWMQKNGIPHGVRPDGSPIVVREHLQEVAEKRRTWDDPFPSVWDLMMTKSVPRRTCGVYFLFLGKNLVYVGMTTNFFLRMASHMAGEKQFDSVVLLKTPEEDLRGLEGEMIARYQPLYNKAGIRAETEPEVL